MTRCDVPAMSVTFHVQAGMSVGMGHLARSAAVISDLEEAHYPTTLHFESDRQGYERARDLGLNPTATLPKSSGPLVIDAIEVSDSLARRLCSFFPRILISPKCNRVDLASHVVVRFAPPELRASLRPGARLVTSPDFAFVTSKGLRAVTRDYSAIRAGICLSGGQSSIDLERIIAALLANPSVAEIRVVDNRVLGSLPERGSILRLSRTVDAPWKFFDGINLFVGGEGVMLAEAIAQAIPAISVTTSERMEKNQSLLASGALIEVSNKTLERAELIGPIADVKRLQEMHLAALRMHGSDRAGALSREVIATLKDTLQ